MTHDLDTGFGCDGFSASHVAFTPLGCVSAVPVPVGEPCQIRTPRRVDLRVLSPNGTPIHGAEVSFTGATPEASDTMRSDKSGRVVLTIRPSLDATVDHLTVEAAGYWGLSLPAPTLTSLMPAKAVQNQVVLSPITPVTIDRPCWAAEAMGLDQSPLLCGFGTSRPRVAIVTCDSIAGPRSGISITNVSLTSCTDPIVGWEKSPPKSAGTDPVLAALVSIIGTAAAGAEVWHLCLPRSASQADVEAALGACCNLRVDVVCLCLASYTPDPALTQTLQAMHDAGVLVIAPVGDQGRQVAFPAALPCVLGVGAVGRKGTLPPLSPHARLMGEPIASGYAPLLRGPRGPGIDVVAPGIGLLPADTLLSGSILAAACITGYIARLLQSLPSLSLTPPALRVTAIRTALFHTCVDLGLPPSLQGAGLPIWGSRGRQTLPMAKEKAMARQAQLSLDNSLKLAL